MIAKLIDLITTNNNFEILPQIGIFELIGIILIILSMVIAYYSITDKGKNETVAITKILKYTIVYIYSLVALVLTIILSFRSISNEIVLDCTIVNTIKVSIYLAVATLMIFIIMDQFIQYFKERFYKNKNII